MSNKHWHEELKAEVLSDPALRLESVVVQWSPPVEFRLEQGGLLPGGAAGH